MVNSIIQIIIFTVKKLKGIKVTNVFKTVFAKKKFRIIFFLILFAIAGTITLLMVRAGTPAASIEAENSTVTSPAVKISDSAASGGQAIQFKPAGNSLPRPQTMTQRSFKITVSGTTQEVFYWSNGSIEAPDSNVQRVVFVIHGNSRNAWDYGNYGQEAATLAGANPTTTTLVVAPLFVADPDISSGDTSRMYWSDSGWKEGSLSQTSPFARPWRMSSFEVLDKMALQAKSTFSGLNKMSLIGHSAGGQFVSRYGGGTSLPEQMTNVDFRFAIANPSSYLYFDDRRPKNGTFPSLTSSEKSACSGFDTYKYGMTGMNDYMNKVGANSIPDRFKGHKIYYLLGDQDNANTNSLDTGCEANLQGPFRLQRGNNYVNYINTYFGSPPAGHTKLIVPGVAHDGRGMITSSQGRQAIYAN